MRKEQTGQVTMISHDSVSGSEELRIVVQGDLTADVLVELEGFGVRAAEPGLLLFGSVPDQAALGGTLRRLHAAGLVITAAECHRHSVRIPANVRPATHPSVPSSNLARIEVDGSVPAEVGELVECVGRHDNPATTTLEFRLSGDDELFVVLNALEEWGLHLRKLITGI